MNNNATIVFIDRTHRIAGEAKVTKEARDKAANMYIEKKHEQVPQIPDTAEDDDPDEVLCGYCGEHWPFPDSKCHCGFTIKTSRCKIKCDRPDNLAKPWWITGNEIYLDTIVNIDEGIEAFEEPDEANRDHIDNMDECIEAFEEPDEVHLDKIDTTDEEWFCRLDEGDYISSKKKDRNLLAKKDVAEIAVDPADLDPEDIEAMQFAKQFIQKNNEGINANALMLTNAILQAMIKRAPLVIEPGRGIPTSSTIPTRGIKRPCTSHEHELKLIAKKEQERWHM